jgi:hypothetical protein
MSDSNFSIPNPQSAHDCGIAVAQKPRRDYSIMGIGDQEAHNLIVKRPKRSAGIRFCRIGWREYMSTAKIHNRMRIWAIFLFIITTVNGCGYEEDTKPIVSGDNPPVVEFSGTGNLIHLFVSGPFTLEQLKGEYKITKGGNILTTEQEKELKEIYDDKHYQLWELDPYPGRYFNVSTISITYGIIPEWCKQVYPANGKPEPLIEGKVYSVSAPSHNANFKTGYFTIKNNKAVMVTHEELVS